VSIPGQTSVTPHTEPALSRSQRSANRRSDRAVEADVHERLGDVEHWFIKRGLPHFIEDYRATDDVFTRALPLLVLLLMGQLGVELTKKSVNWQHRLIGAGAGLAFVIVLFLVANLIRQPRQWYKWPKRVGVIEIAFLVALGPGVGFAVRHKPGAAALDLLASVGVLIFIYAATAYAVLPVILWALRHSIKEIGNLVNLASRALPMLALFGTFIFLNADMWHIAGLLPRHKLWETVGFFAAITFLFLLVRLPDEVRRLSGQYTAEAVAAAAAQTPLEHHLVDVDTQHLPQLQTTRRQRLNMLFVLGFTQVIQVLLLSVVVFVYFVALGKLAVSDEQISDWLKVTEQTPPTATDPNPYETLIHGPGTLFGFPAHIEESWLHVSFSNSLLQTAILITTFSAFFFAVSAVTDEAYRKDFFESITHKLTRSLDVRCGYISLYVKDTALGERTALANRGIYDPQAVVEDHQRTVRVQTFSAPGDSTVRVPGHFQPMQSPQAPQPPLQQPYQPSAFQPAYDPQAQSQQGIPQQYQPQQSVFPPAAGQNPVPQQEKQPPHHEDPFQKWPQQQ
jgi:hypothetical protein